MSETENVLKLFNVLSVILINCLSKSDVSAENRIFLDTCTLMGGILPCRNK